MTKYYDHVREGMYELDSHAVAVYLELPAESIAMLIAFIGTAELGIVRTIDAKAGIVVCMTTKDFEADFARFLETEREKLRFRVLQPSEMLKPLVSN